MLADNIDRVKIEIEKTYHTLSNHAKAMCSLIFSNCCWASTAVGTKKTTFGLPVKKNNNLYSS